MKNIKLIPVALIILAIASRLYPHIPNFAAVSGAALFAGVYLPKRFAFLIPLSAMLISDAIIGFYGSTMIFVYSSFILTGLVGLWLKEHKNWRYIFLGSVFSSVFFFIITNFGVWVDPVSAYPKSFAGLINSYIMAIPFFRGTILGDLFYTGAIFGGFELLRVLARKFLDKNIYSLLF